MRKAIGMVYGLVCYFLGVLSLLLIIFFANNHMGVFGVEALGSLNIDTSNGAALPYPVVVNLMLLALFGVQHSVMARPGFKAVLTRWLPQSWERSTYVLATAAVLILLVWYWQPITSSLWRVDNEAARLAITILFYVGWTITFLATFMINHFHLFGLQQTLRSSDPEASAKNFVTPYFYKLVRHPIQTGVFIAMLATPDMTVGRALLAAGMILYIFIGLHFEERDLIAEFGDVYRNYKQRVPALIPGIGGRGK